MSLLKTFLEVYYLLKSIVYLLTFPLHVVGYLLESLRKKIWISIISIGWFQKLSCPRLGTNLFSRVGRIVLTNSNVHVFFGGALAGVAILFVLYQPVLRQFDGKYYLVFEKQASTLAYAETEVSEASASADIAQFVVSPSPTSDPVVQVAMPIVTEIAPTPTPVPVVAKKRTPTFGQPQALPVGFVPPAVPNTGAYFSPLRNPPRLLMTTRFSGGHPGIDLATEYGTPIYAVGDGYVESVGSTIWAYGNVVYVNHGGGVVSLYAHMSRVDVKPGQQVTKDTVIGAVGSTGNSSGPHVHLELHNNGRAFNPLSVMSVF